MDELYEQNANAVYRFLLAKCHDEQLAEDLTQETFLQAYKSIGRYNGQCKVSVWLCQIAKHLWYQHLQKHRKESGAEIDEARLGGVAGAEAQVFARYELLDVMKRMQKLPQQQREVIYLRLTGSLSFREIGEILDRSENWARVNFYRGKETLLKGMKEDERD